ncbi:MAG: DUF1844 domain-containing protein [bacterium]|nr:DUF1844 domain-containing protein [bacterium]
MFTAEGELREDRRNRGAGEDVSGDGPDQETTRPLTAEAASPEPSKRSAPKGRPAPGGELPSPTFTDLVGLLAQPIAMFLGDASMPGAEAEENLPLARFHIDLLELVQTKTKGNISSEEAQLLESLLYQMRMRYVEKAG